MMMIRAEKRVLFVDDVVTILVSLDGNLKEYLHTSERIESRECVGTCGLEHVYGCEFDD